LYDLKLVPTIEPYQKRTSHGMILGEGGVKMSKSVGNVVNPDDIVKTYGADTLRVYEMFMGPFEEAVAWSTESIIGSRRFIEKIWRISEKIKASSAKNFFETAPSESKGQGTHTFLKNSLPTSLTKLLHKTIKKVSEDIESMRFNTAISAMMILATEMEKAENINAEDYKKFLQILAPFAPHITEYIWSDLGENGSIHFSNWPKWDENLIKDQEIKIAVQINGKVRAEILIQMDEKEEDVKKKALANPTVLKYIPDGHPKKVIYVKNRLINILN
jgi:leucyl-tRNA synthetase